MRDTVQLLWFIQERLDADDVELLIGVYRTKTDAESAIKHINTGSRICVWGF